MLSIRAAIIMRCHVTLSICLITLASNFLATTVLAQQEPVSINPDKHLTQYIINSWTVQDGLPSNSVKKCWYGRDGYLWFATYDGLVRFDGVKFTKYTNEVSPAFQTNSVLEIFENEQGMWIGTNGGGLVQKQGEEFTLFSTQETLQGGVITAIEGDGKGGLWLGSRGGMAHFKDSVFSALEHPILGYSNVYDLERDSENKLWIATTGDGVFYEKEDGFGQITEENGLPSNAVRALYWDGDSILWIGTDEGVSCWRNGKTAFNLSLQDGLPSNMINCFLRDRAGSFWIGTDEGLVRYNETDGTVEVLDGSKGLSHSTIESILEDPEGNLWLGTYRGGLNRLKDGKFINYGVPEGMPNDVINATFPVGDDTVWVGTDYGLARLVDDELDVFYLGTGPDANRIRDIYRDQTGRLWLCTYDGLVWFENGRIRNRINQSNGLSSDRVRNVIQDRRGHFWVGTSNGLNEIDATGNITVWDRTVGLENDFIMCLNEASDGAIWVGTNGGGLYIIDGNNITNYTKQNGLQGDIVFHVYQDDTGLTWVGTVGGLSVWDGATFIPMGTAQGFGVNAVFQVTRDNQGNYWINTDKGVVRVSAEELQAVVAGELESVRDLKLFNDADGMRTREVTGASRMGKSQDGKLWVPTLLGVTMINPADIPRNTRPPEVKIEGVWVNQVRVPTKQVISLPKKVNRIVFEYTALTFFASENVSFRYQLEGFDDDWVEAGTSREAAYTNLPPGSYTFRVIAGNNDDVWNKVGATVTLKKPARFIETGYFYGILVLGLVVISFVVYYVRLASLNSRNQLLTQLVDQRTQNLQQQSEAIRQQAEELEMINTIVQTINQEYEMERVLDALLSEAIKLFPQAERGAFLIFNNETHLYEFNVTRGINEDEFAGVQLTPQEAFSTFGEDHLELEDGVYIVRMFRDVLGKISLKNVRSSLVMTIKLGAFPEGFLFLFNSSNHRAFDKSDSTRLKRFRDHALSAYSKAKVLQEMELQKQKLEVYYQNMNDSVQYARRIQEALLPGEDFRKQLFPDSFLYFNPKDVVSGDFFWYGHRDGKKVVAIVDCTGHGVPGAFMSVLGNSLLNQIVNERGITNPDRILNELNRMTRLALQQSGHDSLAADGMDAAICTLNEAENLLCFAGAKRPLFFFRDQQLHVIKGDRFSIGGHPMDTTFPYTEHHLSLSEVDAIYLFSDGYYDQFHYQTGKKFMITRFKNMIREIFPLSSAEQKKQVAERLVAWKGSQEQVDDILVMGILFSDQAKHALL